LSAAFDGHFAAHFSLSLIFFLGPFPHTKQNKKKGTIRLWDLNQENKNEIVIADRYISRMKITQLTNHMVADFPPSRFSSSIETKQFTKGHCPALGVLGGDSKFGYLET
jgi:hypothetical protein